MKLPLLPHSPFELSPIKAIELAAARIPGAVSLAQGIPIVPPAPEIREFIIERIREGRCDSYSLTNGLQELREEIATSLRGDGLNFDPDREIIATAGSIEAITATLLALAEPGSDILLTSPSYTTYQAAVRTARCNPIFVELDEDRGFDLSIEKVELATTPQTKIILISNPNNPTGTVLSEDSIRKLVDWCLARGIWLLVDEVYKDFYYIDRKHFTPMSCDNARRCVIRICSFSKAFAMTGWRIGFMHADARAVQAVLPYHDAMVTCAPVASQYGAIAALRFGAPYVENYRKEFIKRRAVTIGYLDQLSDVLDYQIPNSSYFVFPRIKEVVPLARDSRRLASDILEKSRVALVPGVAFGPSGEGHLRISFGRSMQDIEDGLSRLSDYIRSTGRSRDYKNRNNGPGFTPPALNKLASPKRILKGLIKWGLKTVARCYILITRPTVIGIIGNRGKTVVKRSVTDRLQELEPRIRSSILSYNTTVGLPCSILNIRPPRELKDLPTILSALVFTALELIRKRYPRILVLEYGFSDTKEGYDLLKIAKPSWLIVSGFVSERSDKSWNRFIQAVSQIVSEQPSDRLIIRDSDQQILGLQHSNGPSIDVEESHPVSSLTEALADVLDDSAQFADFAARTLLDKMSLLHDKR